METVSSISVGRGKSHGDCVLYFETLVPVVYSCSVYTNSASVRHV